MPQKVIRKIDLHESQLIKNAVGTPELFSSLDPTFEFNIARHFPTALVGTNASYPVPNKLSNLFDNTTSTQARFVDGSVGKTMVGFPSPPAIEVTNRKGYLIFDFGRQINLRQFEIILNDNSRFIVDDETASGYDPPRGVKLYFQNAIDELGASNSGTNGAHGTNVFETLYQDNSDFTTETIPVGTAPYKITSSTGFENIIGDNETYDVQKLTLSQGFNLGIADGFQFLIVEFRGSRYSYTFDVHDISILEEVDIRDYNVEFDDSVLDLAGWKNPRYAGSKLKGKKINVFTPPSTATSLSSGLIQASPLADAYEGDVSYGKNPVIERKTTALYIADSCIGAEDEDEQFAHIADHSYLGIKQILVINQDDNTVQIIDRNSETEQVFQKFITNDFPVGSLFNTKIIDEAIQHNLRRGHRVKFNKGYLLKSFQYDGSKAPQHGRNTSGESSFRIPLGDTLQSIFTTFPNAALQVGPISQGDGDGNVKFNVQVPAPLVLFEAIEGGSKIVPNNFMDLGGDPPTIDTFLTDNFDFGPFYESQQLDDANRKGYDYTTNPLDRIYNSFTVDGSEASYGNPFKRSQGKLKFHIGGTTTAPLMLDSNTKLIRNKFTEQFVKPPKTSTDFPSKPITFDLVKIQEIESMPGPGDTVGTNGNTIFNTATSSDGIALILPEEVVNFRDNLVNPSLNITFNSGPPNSYGSGVNGHTILQNRIGGGITRLAGQGIGGYDGPSFTIDDYIDGITTGYGTFAGTGGLGVFHPNNIPLSFIKGCLDHLNENQTTTELYLTLHQGRKDFSGKNDTLSIGTFECDPRVNTSHFSGENPVDNASNMILDDKLEIRAAGIFLKNDVRNLPPISQLADGNTTSTGLQTIVNISRENTSGNDTSFADLAFYTTVDFTIVEKGKVFEAGPGVPSNVPTRLIDASDGTNPHENVFINGGTNALTAIGDTASAENNIPLGSPLEGNTQNYPGAENNHYHFQLSFLDKGPTLIANIDKDNELFDGIGEKGLVLVPEFLEGDIKKNIEFYLRKAGIIEKRTIKAPPRPERGR